ncbi:hypothetical protein ACTA71_002566 [Dictyostelium dimigraforme]
MVIIQEKVHIQIIENRISCIEISIVLPYVFIIRKYARVMALILILLQLQTNIDSIISSIIHYHESNDTVFNKPDHLPISITIRQSKEPTSIETKFERLLWTLFHLHQETQILTSILKSRAKEEVIFQIRDNTDREIIIEQDIDRPIRIHEVAKVIKTSGIHKSPVVFNDLLLNQKKLTPNSKKASTLITFYDFNKAFN